MDLWGVWISYGSILPSIYRTKRQHDKANLLPGETKVGEHRSYVDANKLVNIRRDIMKKNRLRVVDIEEMEMKMRQKINAEQWNPEDGKVRLKNITPEQVKNTLE